MMVTTSGAIESNQAGEDIASRSDKRRRSRTPTTRDRQDDPFTQSAYEVHGTKEPPIDSLVQLPQAHIHDDNQQALDPFLDPSSSRGIGRWHVAVHGR